MVRGKQIGSTARVDERGSIEDKVVEEGWIITLGYFEIIIISTVWAFGSVGFSSSIGKD
jgi:hypothetical protein